MGKGKSNDIPTLEEFKTFFNSRADLLDSIEMSERNCSKATKAECAKVKSLLIQKQKWTLCKETHRLSNCEDLLKFTAQKRAEHLRKAKLCLNCMKLGHFLKECKFSLCKRCSGKHNISKDGRRQKRLQSTKLIAHQFCARNYQSGVLLATALVLVMDK